jgi:hypothetical protein
VEEFNLGGEGKLFRKKEDFFLKVRIDRHCKKV